MMRYDDDRYEDDSHPRSSRRDQPEDISRRESLIERRMRAVRGEDYEYDDDDADARPAVRYRQADRYMPRHTGPSGPGATVLYVVLGFVAVGLVLLLVAPRILSSFIPKIDVPNVPAAIQQVVATPTTTLIDRGGTIREIRSLSRLETQQFSADRVIEAKNERGNPLDVILGDKLLLIASGTVIAGVDMEKLQDSNVILSPDGKSITLTLPPTEIFQLTLDNQRTRVYDRQTGVFANQSKDLETQARQRAEGEILQAACEANVMQRSANDAQRALEQFLKLAGFEQVTVNASAGQCVAPTTVPLEATATP